MKQVIVRQFGGPDCLELADVPGTGEALLPGYALVRITCIGMNHADLMMREGDYRLSSGEPPFTPGIEGGGVVEAVAAPEGGAIPEHWPNVGQRVVLPPTTRPITGPRPFAPGQALGGSYRSHYKVPAEELIAAPAGLPDDHLGCLWLAYLTAWGCIAWKQDIQAGEHVLITAASSPVSLAAAQIARSRGAIPIGVTSSPGKVEQLLDDPTAPYEKVLATRDASGAARAWTNEIRRMVPSGVKCVFDPVAAGPHMDALIKVLGLEGTIWIYGLLGQKGPVDLFPLIRKWGAIRGWLLNELVERGPVHEAMKEVVARVAEGEWRLPIAQSFPLADVAHAHEVMAAGSHFGKLILVP